MSIGDNIYQYLESKSVGVGIDALTITAYTPTAHIGISAIISALQEYIEHLPLSNFNYMGAKGWYRGSVRYAEKRSKLEKRLWSILMITGALSETAIAFYPLELKATRIDLCVDVEMESPNRSLASMMYKVSEIAQEKGHLIVGSTGETLYPVSNREGTYYGRLYDKSATYGRELGSIWRYEVEIKRKAADKWAANLLKGEDIGARIEGAVYWMFREKFGIPTPKPGTKPTLPKVSAHVTDSDRKIDWIRSNVAPTVRALVKEGYGNVVRDILGFLDNTTDDI